MNLSIEQIICYGKLFDFKQQRGGFVSTGFPEPLNPQSIEQLFNWLGTRQIDYVLVGGVAMLNYIEGRNTQDIDFLMSPADLARLPELEVTSQDQNFARALLDGLQVDLLLTSNSVFERVMQTPQYRTLATFAKRTFTCASPEGLSVLKLYALPSLYRQGQFQRANLYEGDLTALQLAFPELDFRQLLETLNAELLPSDIQELIHLCAEIEQRVARLRRTHS